MLNHTQARQIAEELWGRGGTDSRPTGVQGAYYFSCSGHGGFIIDAAALQFDHPTKPYRLYNHSKLWWEGRRASLRYNAHIPVIEGSYYVFEEDCDWCIPVKFGGIWPDKLDIANETWWNWFDFENPQVQKRLLDARRRYLNDPDLIVWAQGNRVGTADGQEYTVTKYRKPNLSQCEGVQRA